MFYFLGKDRFDDVITYTFDILNPDKDAVGKIVIVIGEGRPFAGVVFDKTQVAPENSYEYLEALQELLDYDLLDCIDESHNKIFIAEIVYEEPRYLF